MLAAPGQGGKGPAGCGRRRRHGTAEAGQRWLSSALTLYSSRCLRVSGTCPGTASLGSSNSLTYCATPPSGARYVLPGDRKTRAVSKGLLWHGIGRDPQAVADNGCGLGGPRNTGSALPTWRRGRRQRQPPRRGGTRAQGADRAPQRRDSPAAPGRSAEGSASGSARGYGRPREQRQRAAERERERERERESSA